MKINTYNKENNKPIACTVGMVNFHRGTNASRSHAIKTTGLLMSKISNKSSLLVLIPIQPNDPGGTTTGFESDPPMLDFNYKIVIQQQRYEFICSARPPWILSFFSFGPPVESRFPQV